MIARLSVSPKKTRKNSQYPEKPQNGKAIICNFPRDYSERFSTQRYNQKDVHFTSNQKGLSVMNNSLYQINETELGDNIELEQIDDLIVDNIQGDYTLPYQKIDHKRPQKGVRKYKITAQEFQHQNNAIYQIVSQEPTIGLKEVVSLLKSRHNLVVTKSSVHKRLVDQLGLEFQSIQAVSRPVVVKNDQQTLKNRKIFLQAICNADTKDFIVCGISKFTGNLVVESAWLPKQRDDSQMESFLKKVITPEDTINLLVSITFQEVVLYDTFMGNLTPNIFKDHLSKVLHRIQTHKKQKYILISESLLRQLQRYTADNSSIKLQESVASIVQKTQKLELSKGILKEALRGIRSNNILFLPYFSPHLDPSTNFFMLAHKKFKAYKVLNKKIRSKEQLQKAMQQVIRYIPYHNFPNFFTSFNSILRRFSQRNDPIQ